VLAPEPDGATARYSPVECLESVKKEAVLIGKSYDRLWTQHCKLRDAINAHLQALGESETLPRVKPIKPPSPNDGWLSWFVKLDRVNGKLEQTIHDDKLKLERCEQAAQMDEETAAVEKQTAELKKQTAELEKQARATVKALEARKKAALAAVLGQPSVVESPDVFEI
jgi:hypothetical protein